MTCVTSGNPRMLLGNFLDRGGPGAFNYETVVPASCPSTFDLM